MIGINYSCATGTRLSWPLTSVDEEKTFQEGSTLTSQWTHLIILDGRTCNTNKQCGLAERR